ncbi:hypothetical protein BDP81DRAFT_416843 [Colletotrichum phormii]|uniref:Uncharacterized protein n=1 Tax=Colletotrichum phormii TaxID=359342 RepID=A0AAJ0A1W0_9PEZI|nr:uncharacterized protein BDP81DRAFT_416843 [Colletotrichum phormii]KAK1654943.1 hypothetical protein BDP81DRAFT_416843 [Colletotrichum phormii]
MLLVTCPGDVFCPPGQRRNTPGLPGGRPPNAFPASMPGLVPPTNFQTCGRESP